jgi:hypothetical protein
MFILLQGGLETYGFGTYYSRGANRSRGRLRMRNFETLRPGNENRDGQQHDRWHSDEENNWRSGGVMHGHNQDTVFDGSQAVLEYEVNYFPVLTTQYCASIN